MSHNMDEDKREKKVFTEFYAQKKRSSFCQQCNLVEILKVVLTKASRTVRLSAYTIRN